MPYVPTTWNDGGAPALSAANLNKLEQGIKTAQQTADEAKAAAVTGGSTTPATDTTAGVVELATVAEAQAGTDTTRAVTPAGVKAVADGKAPATHTHTASQVSDATTTGKTLLTAADAAAARSAIGAGTSSLTLGTTSSTAAAGNHSHTSAAITDLTEAVQDIVGGFVKAGTGTTVAYDDSAGTFTISATATGGSTDPEVVRDVIGAAMVAGSGIQITVNDAGDQITVASTAVQPTRKITTTAPLTGGGDLSADRTLGLNPAQVAVTSLGVGALADGQMLVRSGSSLVGAAVPSGGGGGAAYAGPNGVVATSGTAASTTGYIGSQPAGKRVVWIPKNLPACTITSLTINVKGAGDGSAVIRMAIYADAGGGIFPSTKIGTDVTVPATSTGDKTATGLGFKHTGGVLWFAAVAQGFTQTCPQVAADTPTTNMVVPSTNDGYPTLSCQDDVAAELPTTPSPTAQTNVSNRIWIGVAP